MLRQARGQTMCQAVNRLGSLPDPCVCAPDGRHRTHERDQRRFLISFYVVFTPATRACSLPHAPTQRRVAQCTHCPRRPAVPSRAQSGRPVGPRLRTGMVSSHRHPGTPWNPPQPVPHKHWTTRGRFLPPGHALLLLLAGTRAHPPTSRCCCCSAARLGAALPTSRKCSASGR